MIIASLAYKAKDIMDKDFIVLNENENLNKAINRMIEMYKQEVIIEDVNGKLLGIITRKDLDKVKDKDCFSLESCVQNLMNREVITIEPETSVREARNLMLKYKIGRLPVVQNNRVLGVLTSDNIRDKFYLDIDEMFLLQRNILENIYEAVCICDSKGIVNYWNKSAERLYNVKADDIVGSYIGDFYPNAMILHVLKDGKRIENVRHEPVEGKLVILSTIPIYNSNNELISVVSTDRDITEVVNLSKELNNEKTKVELLKDAYQKEISDNYSFSSIVGKSKKIIESIALAQKVSHTTTSVLITGESGTGKEVFAKGIHEASGRNGHFVAVNCSAIPGHLLESELFGYVEGAFTGASKKGKIGKFELANNGTLFLDEIGDMPFDMQAKLLRVLQDGVVYKLGSEKGVTTNVRILAATNKNLKVLIKEKKFREDLFYRLAVVQIELPPLRERKEDIKELINLFVNQISKNEQIHIGTIDDNIYEILSNYNWEGNIRELKNVIQRMVVLSNNGEVSVESIPEYILGNSPMLYLENKNPYDLQENVSELEKRIIKEAMLKAEGNKVKAAQILNIKRSTLYYKLNQYNL